MTKEELAKYAGKTVYAQVRRMGGKYRDIDCITEYRITERGTLRFVREVMSCVANHYQIKVANRSYPNRAFGRPTADRISLENIEQ